MLLETLADRGAVLVIEVGRDKQMIPWIICPAKGLLKQGHVSGGVARQHIGLAGQITNVQIGAFAAYASRHDRAPSGWRYSLSSGMRAYRVCSSLHRMPPSLR